MKRHQLRRACLGGLVEEGHPPSDVMLGGGREEEEEEGEEEGGRATFSSLDWRHIRSATKGDTICTDFFETPLHHHHPNAVNAGRGAETRGSPHTHRTVPCRGVNKRWRAVTVAARERQVSVQIPTSILSDHHKHRSRRTRRLQRAPPVRRMYRGSRVLIRLGSELASATDNSSAHQHTLAHKITVPFPLILSHTHTHTLTAMG